MKNKIIKRCKEVINSIPKNTNGIEITFGYLSDESFEMKITEYGITKEKVEVYDVDEETYNDAVKVLIQWIKKTHPKFTIYQITKIK